MPGTSHPIQTSGSDERPECEDRLAAQREALEEMSQQLLDKLNVMVEEQEARAQEFAQRVHSSYQLSEQGEWRTSTSAPKGKYPLRRLKEEKFRRPCHRAASPLPQSCVRRPPH